MSLFSLLAAAALLAVLIWLLKQPSDFRVVRCRTIHAAPETIFPLLQDLQRWPDWSPWLIHEPSALLNHSDSSDKVGSWYSWHGELIGEGKICHEHIEAPHRLNQTLLFQKPMRASHQVRFEVAPHSEGNTRVEWIMEGKLPFLFRWMGPMMDRMVGGDFELGLVQLAREAGDPEAQLQIKFQGRVSTSTVHYGYQTFEGAAQALPHVLEKTFSAMLESAEHLGLELTSEPFVLYHRMNASTGQVYCDICLPIAEGLAIPGYQQDSLHAMSCERTQMKGDYPFLPLAWHAAFSHLRMHKLKQDKSLPMVERYVSHPEHSDSLGTITQIDLPVR